MQPCRPQVRASGRQPAGGASRRRRGTPRRRSPLHACGLHRLLGPGGPNSVGVDAGLEEFDDSVREVGEGERVLVFFRGVDESHGLVSLDFF